MARQLDIRKDPEGEMPVQVMEKAIVDIANGAKKLLGSRLQPRAIHLLIQDSLTGNVPLSTIRLVLEAAADLEQRYLKKEGK